MAKVFIYDQDKNITDTLDSEQYSLDQLLALLVERTDKPGEISLRVEECFDSTDTYFNVMFVPNVLRVDPQFKD
jgi:hypothetical protein